MKRSAYVFGLLILCLIWLSSCATSKNTDTQRQVDYSNDFMNIQKSIESLKTDFSKQTKITTDKLSNLKIENKTVYLSPPDSTGRQYPVQESTTTASKDEQEHQQVDETMTITVRQLTSKIDSLTNKVDALMNERSKTVELSWWELHKDKVYCIVIGLLLLLVLIYKVKNPP